MEGYGSKESKVRYAVVGLGYISQAAVLPAFAHAENSELAALISGDAGKREALQRRYGVPHAAAYEDFEKCLKEARADAVYIATPNHLHKEYAVRAARCGAHVLCEKPLAVSVRDCREMIEACEEHKVKLMTAYRLHFERANMDTVEQVRQGRIGEPRFFESVFSLSVKEGNIRTNPENFGGGTLYDLGVYCINAARYLFRDEPYEVFAYSANNGEERFSDIDEMTSAVMRFPKQRLATFTTSFGAADFSSYRIVGTEGYIQLEPAYEYAGKLVQRVFVDGETQESVFEQRDQFAPQLAYFSDCVLQDREPEPSGYEGMNDILIVQTLYQSAEAGRPIQMETYPVRSRPDVGMVQDKPAVSKPELVHAAGPAKG